MSRSQILILACLLLWGCADLRQFNQGAEGTFQAVNLVDIVQSVHGAGSDSCYVEANPLTSAIIGGKPSSAEIVGFGVGYGLLHYELTHWLVSSGHPQWATAWEAVTIGESAYSVGRNYSIGIRIGAPNTDQGYYAQCVHR